MTVQGEGHVLNVRMLRFWNRPQREEPAMLAQALLASGRIDEALGITEAALGREPEDADLMVVRGRAWMARGDLEKAQRLFVHAARHAPDWAEPWRRMGEVLIQRGRFDKALQVLDRAQEMEPEDAGTASLRRKATRMHGLESRLARFLGDPDSEDAVMLAQELLEVGRPSEALDAVEMALADDPDDPDAHLLRARALYAQGLPESARAALLCALRADPSWPEPRRLFEEIFGEVPPDAPDAETHDHELDAFLGSLGDQALTVLPVVNDTVPGMPAPVAAPNVWGVHLGKKAAPSLRGSSGRAYRPPPPTKLFPRVPDVAGWE